MVRNYKLICRNKLKHNFKLNSYAGYKLVCFEMQAVVSELCIFSRAFLLYFQALLYNSLKVLFLIIDEKVDRYYRKHKNIHEV